MPEAPLQPRAVGDLAYGTPIDLTNCDREPIHIPGQIQAHGVLLALDPATLTIQQATENTQGHLGLPATALLGRPLQELLGPRYTAELVARLTSEPLEDNPLFLFSAEVGGRGPFHVIGHTHDGVVMLELELPPPPSAARPDFYELLKRSVSRFQTARTVASFAQQVVEEVRRVSGYDRVMVYRFMPDWSGHVIAESMVPDQGLESYLGLHYPASDIPAQARALFLLNTVRMLPDARYVQARIVPEHNPATGKPLDLSHTFLRGASQMYTEYLNNMGVRATLTMAISRGTTLWGMLVCHHYSPRQISYDVRSACELLARVVSVQMADKQAQEEDGYRRRMQETHAALVQRLASHDDVAQALLEGDASVASLLDDAAVAVITGSRCLTRGDTPTTEQLLALVAWLGEQGLPEVFTTDALPSHHAPAAAYQDTACGILAVQLSRVHGDYVVWMRPELVRTQQWAGDPRKPMETGPFGDRLTPRKSFALWQETVRGTSAPFSPLELEAARRLRTALAESMLVRGEKLARAAQRSRALLQVADALSCAHSEEDVLQVILQQGMLVTGASSAVVDQVQADGSVQARGLADAQASSVQAVRTNRMVVWEPAPATGALTRDARFGTRATLPLGDASNLCGVLRFGYAQPRGFSSEDEEFLLTLAKLCGQALQRARLAGRALMASEAYRSSLVDSLHDHVAVLDGEGVIVEVNAAWRRHALDNGGTLETCGVGANYLDQCRRGALGEDEGTARAVLMGILDVMEGRLDTFGTEYRCATPGGPRAYSMRVSRAAGRAPRSVVVSHSDITSIKRAEENLRDALTEKEKLVREVHQQNLRLEEVNRLKSEFLANMSHELRTPLNGIMGFAQLMADGKAGPISPVHREYLGDVLSSARHLHDLINDVLDLAKVESGKIQFQPGPVDLEALLRDVRDILRPVAAQKDIHVEHVAQSGLEDIILDASRFRQVLFNLLSNAIKFTPDHGHVRMEVRPEGRSHFRLEVSDTGVGIREEDLPRLFVEFQQLDSSTSKKFQGTGLGLSLTKRLVEAQGGTVGVRSIPGKGSVFFAVLPRTPDLAGTAGDNG